MTKNGKNPQNYVIKSVSNTEFDLRFDKNHSKPPFSMVFVGFDTYLIDISNLENSYPTLRLYVLESIQINIFLGISPKILGMTNFPRNSRYAVSLFR